MSKTYLLIYSDAGMTTLNKTSLTADEFEQMLVLRKKIKAYGAGFMVVDANDGCEVMTGPAALKATAKLVKAVASAAQAR